VGNNNAAYGTNAGRNVTGNGNSAFGQEAGRNVVGDGNLALGQNAGQNVEGEGNLAQGKNAGQNVTGANNTAAGAYAGYGVQGDGNTAGGLAAGRDVVGNNNVAQGSAAGSGVRGNDNVSIGSNAGRGSVADRSVSVGADSSAATQSVAVGAGAVASAGNSVALGAGSSAARGAQENYEAYGMAQPQSSTGEVNVGGRQMTGVAAGSEDTDAVNVGQLRAASSASEARVGAVEHSLQNLRSDLESQERMLSAGVAAAMATASLPQAYLPGRNMLSMAGGTWNGESGYALGLSRVSSGGRWVYKVSANGTSRGDFGGAAGVGYQW
jgi:autotransporter adhesin